MENEPRSFKEAKDLKEWRYACKGKKSSQSTRKRHGFYLKTKSYKGHWSQMGFQNQKNADGTINKYKSWLVAKGYISTRNRCGL